MPFVCEYCGYDYEEKRDLAKHISNRHINLKNDSCNPSLGVSCSLCNSKFSYLQKLDDHIKLEHNTIIKVDNFLYFQNEKDIDQWNEDETEVQIQYIRSQGVRVFIPDVRKQCTGNCKVTHGVCKMDNLELPITCHANIVCNHVSKRDHALNIWKNGDYNGKRRYEFDKSEENEIVENLVSEDYIYETVTNSKCERDSSFLTEKCNKIYKIMKNKGLDNIPKSSTMTIEKSVNKMLNLMNKYNKKQK